MPAGPKEGRWYRRQLKEPGVAFSSARGRGLFAGALQEAYFPLAECYETQADPAFCGLGSLAMVLNALEVDPGRPWVSPTTGEATVWRWFSDQMLECCEPLDQVRAKGINMDKVRCLAVCNGARTRMTRAQDSTLDAFRADLRKSCGALAAGAQREFVMCSYSRKTLNQTGDGHFSPMAAYNEKEDQVLIMDVARFKYKPHWVPVQCLWEAMLPLDTETGKSRGWYVLWKEAEGGEYGLGISCKDDRWRSALRFLDVELPECLLKASHLSDGTWEARLMGILSRKGGAGALRSLFVAFKIDGERRAAILAEVRKTTLHRALDAIDASASLEPAESPTKKQCVGSCDAPDGISCCLAEGVSLTEAFCIAVLYSVLYSHKPGGAGAPSIVEAFKEISGGVPEVLDLDRIGDVLQRELKHLNRQVTALKGMCTE